jgi:hypothetical protein
MNTGNPNIALIHRIGFRLGIMRNFASLPARGAGSMGWEEPWTMWVEASGPGGGMIDYQNI